MDVHAIVAGLIHFRLSTPTYRVPLFAIFPLMLPRSLFTPPPPNIDCTVLYIPSVPYATSHSRNLSRLLRFPFPCPSPTQPSLIPTQNPRVWFIWFIGCLPGFAPLRCWCILKLFCFLPSPTPLQVQLQLHCHSSIFSLHPALRRLQSPVPAFFLRRIYSTLYALLRRLRLQVCGIRHQATEDFDDLH